MVQVRDGHREVARQRRHPGQDAVITKRATIVILSAEGAKDPGVLSNAKDRGLPRNEKDPAS